MRFVTESIPEPVTPTPKGHDLGMVEETVEDGVIAAERFLMEEVSDHGEDGAVKCSAVCLMSAQPIFRA